MSSPRERSGPSGQCEQIDIRRALCLLGLRGQIHPADAVAFVYRDLEYFHQSAKRDREIHGNDVIGPFPADAGLVGVVDLRPQLARLGATATDPALPDSYGTSRQPARTQRTEGISSMSFSFTAIGRKSDVLRQLRALGEQSLHGHGSTARDAAVEAISQLGDSDHPSWGTPEDRFERQLVVKASGHTDASTASMTMTIETHWVRQPGEEPAAEPAS